VRLTITFAPNWQGARGRVYRTARPGPFPGRVESGDGDRADAAMLEVNAPAKPEAAIVAALGRRSIVLIGMMGAGKSSVGRRLASRLGLTFVDADSEIEAAAGMSIADIFAAHGEAYFRSGEARVIARLLEGGPQVMATGGGAIMNPNTRTLIRAKGVSIWLDAEYEVLLRRVKRRTDRPMLKTADPADTLRRLLDERRPVYANADLTIRSREAPHETIVSEAIAALAGHLGISKSVTRGQTAP
jgi:shikimate kinase